MLIDKLSQGEFDFDKLPDEIKESLDFFTESRLQTKGTAVTKLGTLDLALFEAIEYLFPAEDIINNVRAELEMNKKIDSNNSFNSTGQIDLNQSEAETITKVDNMVELSTVAEITIGESPNS